MSERITRKDAQRSFERLINAIGGRVATAYNDVGAYRFDYNATYGGVNIELINNAGGGVSQPFGSQRMKPAEFVQAVRFACDVLRAKKQAA